MYQTNYGTDPRRFTYGWIIKGGQKHTTSHHEKGARDKNREAQKVSEVGHPHNVRKREDAPSPAAARSRWFDDQAAKIPQNSSWFS
jgi:hypothetical protein